MNRQPKPLPASPLRMIKLCDNRLHLFLRLGCQNWFYRWHFHGKYHTKSARTHDLKKARSIAQKAYQEHCNKNLESTGVARLSWDNAVRGVLNSIKNTSDNISTSKLRDYTIKLNVLGEFFRDIPLSEINSSMIDRYLDWRKNSYRPPKAHFHGVGGKKGMTPTNKTISRDFDALRRVLQYAVAEGAITEAPAFPKLQKLANPRDWFEESEVKHLFKTGVQWINDAPTTKHQEKRKYCVAYAAFLLGTGIRVDECFGVTYGDVTPIPDDPKNILIDVRHGKMSNRMQPSQIVGLGRARLSFELQCKANPQRKPEDRLFPYNPCASLEELLSKAELLYDKKGRKRTAKNLRHSFIMDRLRAEVPIFALAKNCRTSVAMIEKFYGSHFTPRMSAATITGRKSQEEEQRRVQEQTRYMEERKQLMELRKDLRRMIAPKQELGDPYWTKWDEFLMGEKDDTDEELWGNTN